MLQHKLKFYNLHFSHVHQDAQIVDDSCKVDEVTTKDPVFLFCHWVHNTIFPLITCYHQNVNNGSSKEEQPHWVEPHQPCCSWVSPVHAYTKPHGPGCHSEERTEAN